MTRLCRVSALSLTCLLALGGQALHAQDKTRAPAFGALEASAADAVRAQAQDWLRQTGKTDAATTAAFERIWKAEDRPVLDRLGDTFALGNAAAAKLLAEARDPASLAPTEVPAILKNEKQPAFFRNNLALAYARLLSNRRVHEEALATLTLVRPEQVVDPAAYLFHRAVCEHALLTRTEASRTIGRLLDEAAGAPDRYTTVAALMLVDMQAWKDKDLGAVARKMENIERRLGLARGGPQTQRLQKEVVARLDELIKHLENKAKQQQGQPDPNGGGCPDGGQPQPGNQPGGANNPTSPMPDSILPPGGGTGQVNTAKLRQLQENWGKLPERERVRALQDLTRGLSSSHREAIENYFRNLAQVRR